MNPRTALVAYHSSCRTSAQQIKRFLAGRKSFALAYSDAKELDDMVGVLVDKIEDMEDTWEDVLEVVRQHSIDTRKDTLLKEWAGLVESTRKIVEKVLRISDRFHVASPDDEDHGFTTSEDELYFIAGDHGYNLSDTLGTGDVTIDINGACQWTGAAEEDISVAEVHANGDEVRRGTPEVVQSGTGLNRGILETTSDDRRNCDTRPEPAMVPDGTVKSRRLVLDVARRSSYLKMDRIKSFLDCHNGMEVTGSELKGAQRPRKGPDKAVGLRSPSSQ
jgi:hypothetical protein